MILKIASQKAITYACKYFHYAERSPTAGCFGYSVFNDKNEWCGVILFGAGANNNVGKPFGLRIGQIMELTRMALNGKQESTSQAMAIAIRLLKKDRPLVKMLVSYADTGQNHKGIIYQATNWTYTGLSSDSGLSYVDKNGKKRHARVVDLTKKTYNITREEAIKKLGFTAVKITRKHRYIYFLDKSMLHLKQEMGKPYPKE